MKTIRNLVLLAVGAGYLAVPDCAGHPMTFDGCGRIRGMATPEGAAVEFEHNIVVAQSNWTAWSDLGLGSMTGLRHVFGPGESQEWTGTIALAGGGKCLYRQKAVMNGGTCGVTVTLTSDRDMEASGFYLFLQFPVAAFARGSCEAGKGGETQKFALPELKPDKPRLAEAAADRVTVRDGAGDTCVKIRFDQVQGLTLQDERRWAGNRYSVFAALSTNTSIRKGESLSVSFSVEVEKAADHALADLAVAPGGSGSAFDGFGGNFVYQIDSPVTRHNVEQLDVAWARTQMSLFEWEPQNDDSSPTNTHWKILEANDRFGSSLRQEFQLSHAIQASGIPWIISVWDLPQWMYEGPRRSRWDPGRRIAPGQWDEVVESVVSYLDYARRVYRAEPDFFSFNECGEGVRVLLSPEEHRDMIARLGAEFTRRGFKTRFLLGDSATPAGTHQYALRAAGEGAILKYVGALSVHSWGGGTAADWQAWQSAGKTLERPVFVAEMGVDPDAWRTPWIMEEYAYAMRELRLYQEIVQFLRPRGILLWELTRDYPLGAAPGDVGKPWDVAPTRRFWIARHFFNLTPKKARILETSCDREDVRFTALAGPDDSRKDITLHVANLGCSRPVRIRGLGKDVESLRVYETSETSRFKEGARVEVRRGEVQLDLPARALVSLTSLPEENHGRLRMDYY